jgi:hypothetical protein
MKWLALLALAGCGAGLSDTDAKVASDSVLSAASLQDLCARGSDATDGGAVDAGACTPSQVRALSRELLCGAESLLIEHGKPVPDAGAISNAITCAPIKTKEPCK